MNNIVFGQEVERYQNLDGEPLDQVERKTLEVVHLDELVEVDRKHFEGDHEVLPKHKLIQPPDNILLVFRVLVIQVLHQFGFHQSLLVQPLFVLQDLKSAVLFVFVVKALENDSETSFSKLLNDLVSKSQVLIDFAEVFITIGIESIITRLVEDSHFGLSSWHESLRRCYLVSFPFLEREEINGLVLEDLSPLHFPQVVIEQFESILTSYREPRRLQVARSRAILLMPER